MVAASLVGLGTLAASGTAATRPTAESGVRRTFVFNGEANNLNVYRAKRPFRHQRLVTNAKDDPDGLDINAQICFFPQDEGKKVRRFIAGEDTNQPDPPQGWGVFELRGRRIDKFQVHQIAKLTPTFQGSLDNAENYGCGFLADGRVLTSDIGDQASGAGDGQLIVWFPPFDTGIGGEGQVRYCKIDTALATAGQIAVDGDDQVFVASARPPTAGIWRYSGPFPTSDTAEGGCGRTDATGAPLADAVQRELFIPATEPLATPNAIVRRPDGGFYVSSVINGVIAQYDDLGRYVRTVLSPPTGETLGPEPFSTGTPLGLGVTSQGTLFYADIGIVVDGADIGPGDHTGQVRRIRFDRDGEPVRPVTVAKDLGFPDGIGIVELTE
ncbi:MAG TPA: hypothetical protein VFF40_00315 [Acidimicrobiia bacterium]|nr:hypothetical protein [Acidimicrobiia bacterium]